MKINLYQHLTVYGTVYATTHYLNEFKEFVGWTEENFKYVKYNPRKPVERYGLSITSLDGNTNGIPDLDSLYDYCVENNIIMSERDFATPTPVYDFEPLAKILDPIKKYLFRSHVLKINPGGFFPPHRDFRGTDIDSFRIIIPLQHMNPPSFTFIVDDKIQYWEPGFLYFVDTAKMHYLFNSSFKSTYMIVLNVDLNEETVKFITENLKER
jgi:hypothetical protein